MMRSSKIWLERHQALCFLMVIALPLLVSSGVRAAPCDTPYNPEAGDSAKYLLKLDDSTVWQVPGGTISFTLTGLDPQKCSITAYLRFDPKDPKAPNNWSGSRPLIPIRVGETQDKSGIIFNMTLPSSLVLPNVSDRFYPAAELRVIVSEPSASPAIVLDTVREITFARRWFAVLWALAFVVVAAFALRHFGRLLGVPGTGVLRIISTASGWASLAQFQIILWTLVIGAGAVYVMTIKGSLIQISTGALWLLGIAGAATVGSQLKSSQQAQAAPAITRPGAITKLAPEDLSESEVTLSWQVPIDGGAPSAYTVQFREDTATTWFTASSAVTKPRFMVAGLNPNTKYHLQVFATNAAGIGASEEVEISTKAAAPLPPNAPPKATDWIGCDEKVVPADSFPLSWKKVPDATSYMVQYRPHDSDEAWRVHCEGTPKLSATVTGLRANTLYDFRVFAKKKDSGCGPPSNIFRQTTGTRKPSWSDIVTDTNRPAEIDVTRVQMLFFTVISACFVAMKIYSGGAIPEIPETYVTLMGISNGVYLTARFVGR